jgi:hypothetical protein
LKHFTSNLSITKHKHKDVKRGKKYFKFNFKIFLPISPLQAATHPPMNLAMQMVMM